MAIVGMQLKIINIIKSSVIIYNYIFILVKTILD